MLSNSIHTATPEQDSAGRAFEILTGPAASVPLVAEQLVEQRVVVPGAVPGAPADVAVAVVASFPSLPDDSCSSFRASSCGSCPRQQCQPSFHCSASAPCYCSAFAAAGLDTCASDWAP